MKKLLSMLASATIISPGIVAVVSCSIPTSSVATLVDGKDKFKIKKGEETEEITAIDLFSNEKSKMLSVFTMQILEALTFSESKYQSVEKLNAEKKSLGTNGLNLSLENLIDNNKTVPEEDENLPKFIDNTNGAFERAYFSTNDTKFSSVNYDMELILENDTLEENAQWESEKTSTFTGNNSKVMEATATYDKDGKLQKIEKDSTDRDESLEYFLNLTWGEEYPGLFDQVPPIDEKFKDKGVYTLEESESNELYDILTKSTNVWATYLTKDISKDTFKTIHTQMAKVESKLDHGILMLGNFDNTLNLETNTSQTEIVPYEKDEEGNQINKVESHNLIDGWSFFENSANNLTSTDTFIYAKIDDDVIPTVSFEFESQNAQNDKYEIIVSGLNNLIVGFSLMGTKIEQISNPNNEMREDKMIYWYEPVSYQFNETTVFKPGIENMFETLETEKVTIEINKK